jgi:glutathione synthase/RimK-type ligase-like ATP-grasp enzyme
LKIRQLLRFYNFNFASIDFIEGIDNEFYFLEINPVGQFLFHSKEINAPIEKDIFNLIKKGYERKI